MICKMGVRNPGEKVARKGGAEDPNGRIGSGQGACICAQAAQGFSSTLPSG
jgi:hypothetical protein